MKIGIMTWHQYYNYGTTLQLFAMNKILEKLGNEPSVLNYHARKSGKRIGKGILVVKIIQKTKQYLYRTHNSKERTSKFVEFIENNIDFTEACDTLPELERQNGSFDAFICGSDQIWAPSVFDPHYFLDFVSDKEKTIAYAPSVGFSEITDDYIKEKIKKYAGRISHVSTREALGSKIIADLIGRDVENVLDPTLLLERSDWNETLNSNVDFACSKSDNRYMLVYMLGIDPRYWRQIYRTSRELGLELKIIPVFKRDLKRDGCIKEEVGPLEFLELVKNASFVCTDSYHGTLFAIQYGIDFLTFKRFKDSDKTSQNSRIYDVLSKLHLENRIFDGANCASVIRQTVDYNEVYNELQILRDHSMQFLIKALNEVNSYNSIRQEKKRNVKKNLSVCCGCGACKQVCDAGAIKMGMDDEGFITSSVDEALCISCGKCLDVCPDISGLSGKSILGGNLYSYKDYSSDVLMKSSSGGAAYALSKAAIAFGYQVIGCEFSTEENKVKHIVVDNTVELHRLQGSKYIQSDFSTVFPQISNLKKSIIFGTPCQIAAARLLGKGREDIYVDLICHGVPSFYTYTSYLDYLSDKYEMERGKIKTVFRYKPRGWRQRYIFNTDGKRVACKHQNKDPFFRLFEHEICYSKNCYECPWRDKSLADIRVGDYWNARFKKDKTGVSMVLVLTDVGARIVDSFDLNSHGNLEKAEISDYSEKQQINNMHTPVFREEVIRKLQDNVKITEIVKKYVVPFERERRVYKCFHSIEEYVKKASRHEK